MSPAFLLSPRTAQAILIHDHFGHELHTHTLPLQDLEAWRDGTANGHEEHRQGGRSGDPLEGEDEGVSILLVLELPHAFPQGGVSSNRAGVITDSTSTLWASSPALAASPTSWCGKPARLLLAPAVRAHDVLLGLLLTSHALLL